MIAETFNVDLGSLEAEFRTGSGMHKLLIGICIGFIVVFGSIGILSYLFDPMPPNLRGRLLVLPSIPIVISAIALVPLLKRLRWHVLIFQKGFVVQKSRVETVVWGEIRTIREKIAIQHGHETDHHFRIDTESGRSITLNAFVFREAHRLTSLIRERSLPSLLTKAEKSLHSGEGVSFGSLRMSIKGLGNQKEWIGWDEVESISVPFLGTSPLFGLHVLVIRKTRGGRQPWYHATVPYFPNFDIFLILVTRFAASKLR